MKKILFLLFIATFFISGCNKQETKRYDPNSKRIQDCELGGGKWASLADGSRDSCNPGFSVAKPSEGCDCGPEKCWEDGKCIANPEITVNNFKECIAAGNPAMESYPRQCRHKDKTYTEIINVIEKIPAYSHSGSLKDVSGGEATGIASASFSKGTVILHAEFQNLPKLKDGYFYEGWLLRKEPFAFKSTGQTMTNLKTGNHSNDYVAKQILNGYNSYVLTLEPDDGDSAPAEHILEGVMQDLTTTEGKYYCDVATDCVANKQCHPDEFINKKYASDNIPAACTASCEGPIDCGAGKPACQNNVCVIVKGDS